MIASMALGQTGSSGLGEPELPARRKKPSPHPAPWKNSQRVRPSPFIRSGSAPAPGVLFRALAEKPGGRNGFEDLGWWRVKKRVAGAQPATPGAGVLPNPIFGQLASMPDATSFLTSLN
jgi:hypothetical protein